MKKQKALELLCIFLAAALVLGGCNRKTTISREDQLKNDSTSITADVTAATSDTTEATETSEDTTGITEDTTVADQTDATEATDSSGPEETKAE